MEVDRSAKGNYSTELYGAKAAQIIRWEKYTKLGDHKTNEAGEIDQVHKTMLLSELTTKSNLSSSTFPFKQCTIRCKFLKSESTFSTSGCQSVNF